MSRGNGGRRPARFGQSDGRARAPKTAGRIKGALVAAVIAGLVWLFVPAGERETVTNAVARIEQGFSGGVAQGLEQLASEGLGLSNGGTNRTASDRAGVPSGGGEKILIPTPLGAADGPARAIRFGYCKRGGGSNCVVDGDTIRMGADRIRIADIDTPETSQPRCAEEARLGAVATERLHALLNSGKVQVHKHKRDTDKYGRKLRSVSVDGRNVGDVLVAEGLARPYGNGRKPWCV